MKTTHILGLLLWRGGVALVVGYLGFHALRVILRITDPHLELAVAILLTGVLFLFLSVLLDRIEDARTERNLKE